jgi:prefoldin subunit 5
MTQTAHDPLTQLEKTGEKTTVNVEKSFESMLSHLVHQAERLTRLEEQLPQLGKDLGKQITDLESNLRTALSDAHDEQSKAANDTVKGIEDRLSKLEKSIDDLLAGGENEEEKPRTRVDKAHAKDHRDGLPPTPNDGPTELKPPDDPRGIRGRRHARKQRGA